MQVMRTNPPRPIGGGGVRVPETRVCNGHNLLQHIDRYTQRYGLAMPEQDVEKWTQLQSKMAWVDKQLHIVVNVSASDDVLKPPTHASTNVHERDLTAHCDQLYALADLTGIEFEAQVALLTQEVRAGILFDAVKSIELHNLKEYAFVCTGATHRAAGAASRLTVLFYNKSSVVFSTRRTHKAAATRGLIACGE